MFSKHMQFEFAIDVPSDHAVEIIHISPIISIAMYQTGTMTLTVGD